MSSYPETPRSPKKSPRSWGICLDPLGGAVVLSVDEKRQSQALDRTSRRCRWTVLRPRRRPPTTFWHDTSNLFAALQCETRLSFLRVSLDSERGKTSFGKPRSHMSARSFESCWAACPDTQRRRSPSPLDEDPNITVITFHSTPVGSLATVDEILAKI
jgi:hypothetical protein